MNIYDTLKQATYAKQGIFALSLMLLPVIGRAQETTNKVIALPTASSTALPTRVDVRTNGIAFTTAEEAMRFRLASTLWDLKIEKQHRLKESYTLQSLEIKKVDKDIEVATNNLCLYEIEVEIPKLEKKSKDMMLQIASSGFGPHMPAYIQIKSVVNSYNKEIVLLKLESKKLEERNIALLSPKTSLSSKK